MANGINEDTPISGMTLKKLIVIIGVVASIVTTGVIAWTQTQTRIAMAEDKLTAAEECNARQDTQLSNVEKAMERVIGQNEIIIELLKGRRKDGKK